jgi:hypothetical protein
VKKFLCNISLFQALLEIIINFGKICTICKLKIQPGTLASFAAFLKNFNIFFQIMFIGPKKYVPSVICCLSSYIRLAKLILERIFFGICTFYVIYFVQVIVVVLETHARCHLLCLGSWHFLNQKILTTLTTQLEFVIVTCVTLKGDKIRDGLLQ